MLYFLVFHVFLVLSIFVHFFYLLKIQKFKKPNKFLVRQGGTIILVLFLFGLSFLFFLNKFILANEYQILLKDYVSIFVAALISLILGLLDDKYNLSALKQMLLQSLAVICFLVAGDFINHFNLPFFGQIDFSSNLIINSLVTYLWFIIVINAYNWFDGLDGLAGGIGIIALLFFFLISLTPFTNQPGTALIAILLLSLIAGFLFFNFRKAKIYLGSVGSNFIGLMLAVLTVYLGGKTTAIFVILFLPLIDFIFVSIKRILKGQFPWQGGDRLHLHYKLKDAGFTDKKIVLIFYLISFVLGCVVLYFQVNN
jgi:UDP-GlcNAc:undecaprenyl-phosphate GlcNAc-1-phosphate transferase